MTGAYGRYLPEPRNFWMLDYVPLVHKKCNNDDGQETTFFSHAGFCCGRTKQNTGTECRFISVIEEHGHDRMCWIGVWSKILKGSDCAISETKYY